MKMNNSSKQLTDLDISEFEKQFSFKLPQEFREFLLKHNGGTPEEDLCFDFLDIVTSRNNSSLICNFQAINTDSGELYPKFPKFLILHSKI